MQNAPPVVYPVGRFAWGRAVWLSMALLCALGLLLWQLQAQVSSAQVIMAWVFGVFCWGTAALWMPRQTLTRGVFFWSGQAWFWQNHSGQEHGVELFVGLDMEDALLLFVRLKEQQCEGHGLWVCAWLDQAAMPSKWHGFRCAVYSRPKMVMAPDGQADLHDR
jgi:hypothetical protein